MNFQRTLIALAAVAFAAFPVSAAESGKFGKTCIGGNGSTKNICLSYNGSTVSSSYMYKGSIPTKGTHTGCSIKGSTLSCSGGAYRTARGSGEMSPIVVKLSGGKPVSIKWR